MSSRFAKRTKYSNLTNDEIVSSCVGKDLTDLEYELIARLDILMDRVNAVEDILDNYNNDLGYWHPAQMNLPLIRHSEQ